MYRWDKRKFLGMGDIVRIVNRLLVSNSNHIFAPRAKMFRTSYLLLLTSIYLSHTTLSHTATLGKDSFIIDIKRSTFFCRYGLSK